MIIIFDAIYFMYPVQVQLYNHLLIICVHVCGSSEFSYFFR